MQSLRVSFDVMCETLDVIDEDFVKNDGIVSYNFDKKCEEFMNICGWTKDDFAHEVDRRWVEICDGVSNRSTRKTLSN